jgi:integrase
MPDIIALHLRHLELAGRAPETVACRRRALGRLARALPAPLLDADAAELLNWRSGLSVGPGTVAAYVSHARAFYAWACSAGLVEENPAAGLPVPPQARMLPRPIGEASLFAAVAAAPDRIRPWLVLAGWAGLRAKEIAFLRRDCVLETRSPPVLLIARNATKGRRERIVPLSRFVIHELTTAGLPARGWVFRRNDGQPGPNTPCTVSKLANLYLHGMGCAETLHQLRHRFGTAVYRDRRDLRLVQELLGHARVSTTAGYAAWDQADAVAAVEALPVPRHLRVVSE